MFTVAQRDSVRDRVLRLGRDDRRIVAGAIVGSLAVDQGDRYSDVDLTFAVVPEASVTAVLDDWTRTLAAEGGAVPLVDLARGPTRYRVFLLPDGLQLDLSMTPMPEFRPAGPRFKLLFGETAPGDGVTSAAVGDLFIATPARPPEIFGWGVIYGLHARACIERRRMLQAEHYVAAVRDHALSLACVREGRTPFHARGYDDLSSEARGRVDGGHVGRLEPESLRSALAVCVSALLHEGAEADVARAAVVAERLQELC